MKIKGDFRFSTCILHHNINVLPLAITSALCDRTKGTVCSYATVWPIDNKCSIHCLDCSGKFHGKVECQDVGTRPFGLGYRNDYLIISDLKDGCLVKTSAVGTGPSPMWQSNTKHYNCFQNIIKFVYETNNTFWNTHKFEKHLWGLKLL